MSHRDAVVQTLDTGIELQSPTTSAADLKQRLSAAVGSGSLEQSMQRAGQNVSSLDLLSIDGQLLAPGATPPGWRIVL